MRIELLRIGLLLVGFFLILGQAPASFLYAQTSKNKKINNNDFPIVVAIEPNLDKAISKIIVKGIEETYVGSYKTALKTFAEAKTLAPDHPVGHVYTSVVYYLIVTDLRNYAYAEEFETSVKETISIGKKWLRKNKEDQPWANFYVAVAYGISGLYHATYKEYVSAFADGIRGHKRMSRIHEEFPDFYDALYGIGLYDYWYAKILGTFMSKFERSRRKESGIASLNKAFYQGTLAKTFAGSGLIEIYKTESRHKDAAEVVANLIKDYPDFPNLFEGILLFYADNKSTKENIDLLTQFRKKLAKSSYAIPLSYVTVDYYLAQSYVKNKEPQKAKQVLTSFVNDAKLRKQVDLESTPNFIKERFESSQTLLKRISNSN